MKRPRTSMLLVGHPLVATPMTLTCAGLLLAAIVHGNGGMALFTLPSLIMVQRASQQASAYRAWKAQWDAMGDGPDPRTVTPGRVLGSVLLAATILLVVGMRVHLAYMAGYAIGWLRGEPQLLAGLSLLAVPALVGFIHRRARRRTSCKVVIVVAKRILPVPSLTDAYRALPAYCHALLGAQP